MKRVWSYWVAASAGLLFAPAVGGQEVFTLGFEGSASVSGSAGEKQTGTYYATLDHKGTEKANAQGWSIGVSGEGAAVVMTATTAGTAAAPVADGGFFSGGFEKTEVIDPAANGGKNGAVSAIVLSFGGATLPGNTKQRILKTDVELTIPTGAGTAKMAYVDKLKGSGQPVSIVVTTAKGGAAHTRVALDIALTEVVSCCDDPVNVGFSGTLARAGDISAIVDATTLCAASGGQIEVRSAEGQTGEKTVYASIASNLAKGGIQGWSFSIASTGEADLLSVTTAGTAAGPSPGGFFSGGFEKTELIDPTKPANGGKNGAVSAIVLSFGGATLPLVGTESVLALTLRAKAPQSEEPQVANVAFLTGLTGSGQPVRNVVTPRTACNFTTAESDVVFVKASISTFTRGNANDDEKIDIADPIWTINELFRDGPPTTCRDAADTNDDGQIDSSDAVYMIDHLFRGQSQPPPPYPDCGADPTEDTLSCDAGSATSCS